MKEIPLIGIGTWELRDKKCTKSVKLALEIGYRHIDTAHLYENHEAVGRAIKGFDRDKLFITSKFFADQEVEKSCEIALKELKTDYLDLYLLHYPDRGAPMNAILSKLQSLKDVGKVKRVGVSNCTIRHLIDMLSWGFHPYANQVEFHPYLNQKQLLAFCEKNDIRLISYRTLGKGALVTDPLLKQIGDKHGKTAAQVLLRWCTQKNIPVVPKATSFEHLQENWESFDFMLDQDDLLLLDHLKKQHRYCEVAWSDFNYV